MFDSVLLSFVRCYFLAAHAGLAQDAKLIEAAKKEGGKVVVYGSLENDTMDLIARRSRRRPGSMSTSGARRPNKVMDRVRHRNARRQTPYDVVLTTDADRWS